MALKDYKGRLLAAFGGTILGLGVGAGIATVLQEQRAPLEGVTATEQTDTSFADAKASVTVRTMQVIQRMRNLGLIEATQNGNGFSDDPAKHDAAVEALFKKVHIGLPSEVFFHMPRHPGFINVAITAGIEQEAAHNRIQHETIRNSVKFTVLNEIAQKKDSGEITRQLWTEDGNGTEQLNKMKEDIRAAVHERVTAMVREDLDDRDPAQLTKLINMHLDALHIDSEILYASWPRGPAPAGFDGIKYEPIPTLYLFGTKDETPWITPDPVTVTPPTTDDWVTPEPVTKGIKKLKAPGD